MWVKIKEPKDTKKLKKGDKVRVDGLEYTVSYTYGETDFGFDIQGNNNSQIICNNSVRNGRYEIELWEEDKVEPIGKRFFGHKIKVTPETSEMIQKAVFEVGGSWSSGRQVVQLKENKYLFVESNGIVTYGNMVTSFTDNELPELIVELEVVKSLKIVDVIPAKTPEQLQKEVRLAQIKKLEEELAKLKSLEE